MCDDPSVTDLVTRARNGDKQAWDALVERYAPFVWSICRGHRLGGADADVFQVVWLRLVDQLAVIRDPAALAGWLAATTRQECGRVQRAARGPHGAEQVDAEDRRGETGVNEHDVRMDARHAALCEAFAALSPTCQRLIALLIQDPPVPYADISAELGIPVSDIEPSRDHCMGTLRRYPAIAALINSGAPGKAAVQR
jgi:RNA polymerase sigma factor (sigma-70 family)